MLLYNYVGVPNNNLMCCICRAPFTDPVTTTTCQHTFCRDCITRAVSHAPHCPVDRLPLSEIDLGPVNPIVRSLVDELLVECVYKEQGCEARVQRQCLAIHLKEECTYSESGRPKCISVKDEVADKEKGKGNGDSEEATVKTLSSSDGKPSGDDDACSAQSSLSEPTDTPPSQSKRICLLTEQNVLLRHRLDTVEGTVQMLKKEMAVVRTVLNPWVYNATSSGNGTAGPSRATPTQNRPGGLGINGMPSVEGMQPQTRRSSPGEDSATRLNPQTDESMLEPADLASYFPAEDEVRVRRPPVQHSQSQQSVPEYSHTQRQRPPGMGHMHHHSLSSASDAPLSFGALSMGYLGSPHTSVSPLAFYGSGSVLSPPSGPQYNALASQSVSVPIPELDLSSPSLAATLQGLHSSVASLATTIEDIHKKSDLALALMGGAGAALPGGGVVGEVLRLGEEVMGVRATVQGLRMQMHGLMMGNVGMGAGVNMGFRPQGPLNTPGNGASANGEEGAAEGPYGFPPAGGLQNQRMFYPGTALGITKL